MNDHEHVIDSIVWAPLEAARIIESADYSGGMHSGQVEHLDNHSDEEHVESPDRIDKTKLTTKERI